MNDDFYLGALSVASVDGVKYFSSYVGNALLKEENGIVAIEARFPNDSDDSIVLHNGEIVIGQEIMYIPATSEFISFYNFNTNTFRQIAVGKCKGASFGFATIYNDNVFIFPIYYGAIVKIDYDKFVKTEIKIDAGSYEKYIVQEDAMLGTSHVIIDSKVYVPFCNAHAILEFDMKTETYNVYDVGSHGYGAACRIGNIIWLAPRVGRDIIGWNYENKETIVIEELPEKYNGHSFLGGFSIGDDILFFPERANMVLRLDTKKRTVCEEVTFSELCKNYFRYYTLRPCTFISARQIGNDSIFFCTGFLSQMGEYNLSTNNLLIEQYVAPNELKSVYCNRIVPKFKEYLKNTNQIWKESQEKKLDDFLFAVKYRE